MAVGLSLTARRPLYILYVIYFNGLAAAINLRQFFIVRRPFTVHALRVQGKGQESGTTMEPGGRQSGRR